MKNMDSPALSTLTDRIASLVNFETQNVPDTLADRIRNMILSEDLPAGYKFPNENEFCEKLCVGRSTLREAYTKLEIDGLITRSKRGTIVNDIKDCSQDLSFSTAIAVSDFHDVLEFRIMFESETTYLAGLRATDDDILAIKRSLDNMKQSKNELALLTHYDMEFHNNLCVASHNKLLQSIMQLVWRNFESSIYSSFQISTERNVIQALYYHSLIFDAISRHDAATAKEAMRNHVREVYDLSQH